MCNFYARHAPPPKVKSALRFQELPNMEPRYVVRPTDTESVVAIGRDGDRHLVPMRWGLVPPSSADIKTGLALFNARSETIATRQSFAQPFKRGRRCLVPVDGFFEFTGPKGDKQPWHIRPRDGRIMAFAGLWESWRGPKDAPLERPFLSYTIATTTPNAVTAPIHDRMPVLLAEPAQWDLWLSAEAGPDELLALLKPAPDDLLEAYPVTRTLLRATEPGPHLLDRL